MSVPFRESTGNPPLIHEFPVTETRKPDRAGMPEAVHGQFLREPQPECKNGRPRSWKAGPAAQPDTQTSHPKEGPAMVTDKDIVAALKGEPTGSDKKVTERILN